MKLSDIFLLPRSIYGRLTSKKTTLAAGILLVGIINVIFAFAARFNEYFFSKQGTDLAVNIAITAVLVIALGAVDVFFFSMPLFDLFKKFPKVDSGKVYTDMLLKIMKIYMLAHIVVIPVNALVLYLSYQISPEAQYMHFLYMIFIYMDVVMPVWFAAVISRGVNTIYSFQPFFRMLAFAAIYLWSYLEGYAVSYAGDWLINFLMR